MPRETRELDYEKSGSWTLRLTQIAGEDGVIAGIYWGDNVDPTSTWVVTHAELARLIAPETLKLEN